MENARRFSLDVTYNNAPFPGQVGTDIKSISYVDNAANNSDSLDITINAIDDKWLNAWMPEKGATLKPTITGTDWDKQGDKKKLECGSFILDDVKYTQAPDELQVSGVSKPSNTDFSEQDREYIWKETSIKRIGQTIADRYGLGYQFDAEDISVDADEQDGADSTYLNGLCRKYGLILKVYSKKLWIYDREKYKKNKPIKTYTKETVIRGSLSYNTSLLGAYTGGTFSYTDPDTEQDIYCQIGTGPKIKNLSKRATSVADAAAQLCAELNNDNHSITTIQFSVDGEWLTSAGTNIELKGYGKLDGVYFVDKITHKISRSNGFTSILQCSKVRDSFNPKDIGGPPEEKKEDESSGKLEQGAAIKLDKANLYVASTSKKRACRVSGTYYLYDGILIAGRYRITNTPSRCGKKPVGHNVTGWVDADACVIA